MLPCSSILSAPLRRLALAAFASVVLVLAGCGGSSPSEPSTSGQVSDGGATSPSAAQDGPEEHLVFSVVDAPQIDAAPTVAPAEGGGIIVESLRSLVWRPVVPETSGSASRVAPIAAVAPARTPIEVYTETPSVKPGETFRLALSDNANSSAVPRRATVAFDRIGYATTRVGSSQVTVYRQTLPASPWSNCCRWSIGLQFTVPSTWRTGLYRATATLPDGNETRVFFVVRSATPGSTAATVLQVPFFTMQAYNGWGGKSLYSYNSTDSVAASRLSMFRPDDGIQEWDMARWVIPLIRWAEWKGIPLEYISSLDLHRTSTILSPYRLFVTVGHDEYWSAAMRDRVEQHVAAGRNVASFSGNTAWWKIELATDARGRANGILVCTKQPGSTTGNWYETRPEAKMLGASFLRGGYVDENGNPGATQIGLRVYAPQHWVFQGTGLVAGSVFGQDDRILRYEADGADFRFNAAGNPVPTNTDFVPAGTQILALARLTGWDNQGDQGYSPSPVRLTGEAGGWATMTIFQASGTVFNAATTDWARALEGCTGTAAVKPACTITSNVLRTLSSSTPPATNGPVDVYRYSRPNATGGIRYLFTTNAAFGGGWSREAVAFRAYAAAGAGTVPVVRYYADQVDGQRYMFSLYGAAEGWTAEGTAFHAHESAATNTVPVYQFHQIKSDGWYLTYSTSSTPASDWTLDGPSFHVPTQ